MEKMIPLNKQSKKKQREYHITRRGTWYGVNPVSRMKPSGKTYDRNHIKHNTRDAE